MSGLYCANLKAQSIRSNYTGYSSDKNKKVAGFSADNNEFYSPVNPALEKTIACVGTVSLSAVIGIGVGVLAKIMNIVKSNRAANITGIAAGVITALASIPDAIKSANDVVNIKKQQYNPFESDKNVHVTLQSQLLAASKNKPSTQA